MSAVLDPTPAPPVPVPAPAPRRRWLRRLALAVMIVWIVPNTLILAAHLTSRAALGGAASYPGVAKFAEVDAQVWRGAAPTMEGYRQLAADGVTTIVDLRAEAPSTLEEDLAPLGLTLERLPVRDGQSATPGQVERFLRIVEGSPGGVFVHCGAGVGRTGVLAAAVLSSQGVRGSKAVAENLSLGTPSLEQLFTVATMDDGRTASSPTVVTLASRVVDAPRRAIHVLGF